MQPHPAAGFDIGSIPYRPERPALLNAARLGSTTLDRWLERDHRPRGDF